MQKQKGQQDQVFRTVRKMLGVSCAGGIFIGTGLALMNEMPMRLVWIPKDFDPISAFLIYVLLVVVCAAYTLPFDYLSYKAGVRYKKISMSRRRYIYCWVRGSLLQLLLLPFFALSINLAGRAGGKPAAFIIFSCALIFLSVYRGEFSRLIKGYSFRLFVPQEGRGGKARLSTTNYIISILWNQAAFVAAMSVPYAGVTTISQTVTTVLAFTSFSLLGWLFLPYLGKKYEIGNAVLALDLSWAGANLITRSVCTHVGNPNKWIGGIADKKKQERYKNLMVIR